ncbi:hypothetical protein [Arthrobacter sp. zg-Y1110]|uniref:hypothetical protein n=1 Tax=Arthrobacter sp. zg-Y1110 TaxID=2886932 RepID=UPI001D152C56|nr:hypothetical protein [Arthrobacter sp. zg-Y1110]MCC3292599.1 hypothetical protein [Arthrobacter sp. zg-Y1110]UWX86970.1 hypothetical protein N2K99_16590 [Arthrobacter sp. zg-Y1110]
MPADNTEAPVPLPGWNELDLAPAIGEEALSRLLAGSSEPLAIHQGAPAGGRQTRPAGLRCIKFKGTQKDAEKLCTTTARVGTWQYKINRKE